MVDSHYLGYELSWEDSLLDGVDNFIHMVPQHAVELQGDLPMKDFIKTGNN